MQVDSPYSFYKRRRMMLGHGNPRMNECLLTSFEAVGLLASFEGSQFLTAVTSHDWKFFIAQPSPRIRKPLGTHNFDISQN